MCAVALTSFAFTSGEEKARGGDGERASGAAPHRAETGGAAAPSGGS